ncbi:mediator of RNA polymerase II transcription subunit 28 isoform X1 [Danio rerio]|uniref:Mediator of RNA polymerase II transcription subunit 28 isoform X1 n=1 Tax=Danio rerio TaxID=7955 RepID=A0AC58IZT9_DANRE
MASSMGGMFPGQQPPGSHPPPGPGGPGQPGLLTGTPGNRGANNTLVDELEASFEGLISVYRSFWMWPDRLNVSFFRRDYSSLYRNQNRWKKRMHQN